MNDGDKQTLVEEGTSFRGVLESQYKVVVRGTVDGELKAPQVDVTSSGVLTGTVKATRLSSEGVLAGNVEADEVSLAGEVRSNTVVRAKLLEVKLTQEAGHLEVTFGDCVLEAGEMPARTEIGEPLPEEQDREEPAVEQPTVSASDAAESTTPRADEAAPASEPESVPEDAAPEQSANGADVRSDEEATDEDLGTNGRGPAHAQLRADPA